MAFTLSPSWSKEPNFEAMRLRIHQHIYNHHHWYLLQGVLFMLFGVMALIVPGVTAMSAELIIGLLLVVSGVVQLIASFHSRMHWWAFLSGALSIIIGGWMLYSPVAGLFALIMALSLFFTLEGLFELLLAWQFRHARQWGWMVLSGLASLLIAGLLFSGLHGVSVIYLGLLIGINFIFYGIALVMLSASVTSERRLSAAAI